jgi:hypothetical protein
MKPMSLNAANEVADGINPVDDVVPDFDAELIFDHHHQFEAIEPVDPKIVEEACFIRDTFGVYAQMLGNESADLRGNVAHGLSWLREAVDTHDSVSNALCGPAREPEHAIGPTA